MDEAKFDALCDKLDAHVEDTNTKFGNLTDSVSRIETALIGDMKPDGDEGLVQKVRESDRIVKSARKWSFGALLAAIGAELHNLSDWFRGP